MSVTSIIKSPETRTMVITAAFAAPVEKVWQVWADPRKLERWWGPPTYPATVVEHELAPGGRVTYVMTGPEGDKHAGWWRVLELEAPHRLEFEVGFADEAGEPNPTCRRRSLASPRPHSRTAARPWPSRRRSRPSRRWSS